MKSYEQEINDFLEATKTEIVIEPIGFMINKNWKEIKSRMTYKVTLFNPNWKYTFIFYDSIKNSEILRMDVFNFMKKKYNMRPEDMNYYERIATEEELFKLKEKAKLNEYDVLYCLNKIDPGTFKEFCCGYGYDEDSISARNIYIGMIEEYKNLQKLFTEEQLNELIEIMG